MDKMTTEFGNPEDFFQDPTILPSASYLTLNNDSKQVYSVEECEELFGLNYTMILMGGGAEDLPTNLPTNVICMRHAPTLTNKAIIRFIILTIMAIISLVGNIATMINIQKTRRKHQSNQGGHIYNLIYHLSISDIIVTFFCMMGESIWFLTVEWKLGNLECKIFKFAQCFGLYLSTFILVLIGIDRFIAVKYPLRPLSTGNVNQLIVIGWTVSAVLSLPQMIVFHLEKGPFLEPFYQCITYGTYTEAWQEQLYGMFSLFSLFVLPLIILVSSYILTVCTLHRKEEPDATLNLIDPNRRKLIRRAKMKSLRISVAIISGFLVCWTPYYGLMIIYMFIEISGQDFLNDLHTNENLKDGIFFFGMSNSLFNPFIYLIFHLWKPRKREIQRRNSSFKMLFHSPHSHIRRSRKSEIINGSLKNGNGHHNHNHQHLNQHGNPQRSTVLQQETEIHQKVSPINRSTTSNHGR